jgi:hypothetical protein
MDNNSCQANLFALKTTFSFSFVIDCCELLFPVGLSHETGECAGKANLRRRLVIRCIWRDRPGSCA